MTERAALLAKICHISIHIYGLPLMRRLPKFIDFFGNKDLNKIRKKEQK